MNNKRPGKRGDWKQNGIESNSTDNRVLKIVVTGVLIVGIIGFWVYSNWPTDDPKSELYVLTIGTNADMPEIPFMDMDAAALAKSFGENRDPKTFDDAKSFQSSLEKIVVSAGQLSTDDTAMLYVSGHGYSVITNDVDVPKAAILTTDFKPGHTEPVLDGNGAVSIASLISEVAKIDVKTKVIFLDIGHFYQNPRDGVFVNDYVYALHEELKNWPKPNGDETLPDNIWIVTSTSMVEVPLYSTTKKRTLFNMAVESSLSSKFEDSIYQSGQNVSELYSAIYSYTKTHGGDSAPTPLLYRVGTGLIDSSESYPDVNTAIAFYPRQQTETEVDDGVNAKKDSAQRIPRGNIPTAQFVGFQEKADEKKAKSKVKLAQDVVEKLIASNMLKFVPPTASSNSLLIETEKKIRQSFSSFYSARYRIRQYFQVFEATSFFQVNSSDELFKKISDFSDVLGRSSSTFEPNSYEITSQVANKFSEQLAAVTASENEVRLAINQVVKDVNKLTLFESENAFALLKKCELFNISESLHYEKLTQLNFNPEPASSVEDTPNPITFSWPLRDPWRTETKNWQRLSNRFVLSQEVAQHFAMRDSKIDRTAISIQVPQSRFEVNPDTLGRLRDAGKKLATRLNSDFADQGTRHFFTEHSRREIFSVDESFLPEFKGSKNQISQLSLRIPQKQEIVSIENLPDSLIVDRSGTKLRMKIKAQGEGLENVQIEFSFSGVDAPFQIENGVRQTVNLDRGIVFDHEITLSSMKDAVNELEKNEFDMTVSVTGIEKKTSKKIRLRLPNPNRVDIAISRVQGNGSKVIVTNKNLSARNAVMRFEAFPNQADVFRIGLLNHFHRAKKVRVSLFQCAIQQDKILPERINNFVMTETLDGILNGSIKEFLAAVLELPAKMTTEKAVELLSPLDPKLKGPTEKIGTGNGGKAAKDSVPPKLPTTGITKLNNGFLCRVTDLENPTSKWDFWFEVFPMNPNYVDVVPTFKGKRLAIQLQRKDVADAPETIKLSWELLNEKNEKMLVETDFFELGQTSQEVSLMENATSEVLQKARLKVNVDGWPRKFIFDFDSTGFRQKNDLREVRIVKISQSRSKGGSEAENLPQTPMIPLPPTDQVPQFGVRLSDTVRRPEFLNAHIEVDTSVIEHFGLNSKSEILLSPGGTPDTYWRLNYPRAISMTGKRNPAGLLSIFSKVTDFENLPIFVSGYTVRVRPELRLELTKGSVSRFPQSEQRIVFDNQLPKIASFEIQKETIRVGEKPKVDIQVNDRGVGIDQQKGIEFFTSKQRIGSFEELKSVKASTPRQVGNYLEFELPAVKEPGELYLGVRVNDRVGNSVSSLDVFPRRDFSLTVLPMKPVVDGTEKGTVPVGETLYDLTVKVIVGTLPLNIRIHKSPMVSIVPADAIGVREGDSYKFSGLKKGVKYVIRGTTKLSVGDASGVLATELPVAAKGKTRTVELKLEKNR